ncbi:MAG TPA: hypothetical protein VIK30_06905 [Polyangia bacterium]
MRATVHRMWQGPRWRIAVGVAAGIAAGTAISGCPKNPTVVLTTVNVDQTVPLLARLTLNVSSAADPSVHVSSQLVSSYPGLYDGGLLPFFLPAQFPISVDPTYISGPVIVRVDGVDVDTDAILATGSTPAVVVPDQQTEAALTLTAVGHCAGDGGAGDGGDDASACDGGADGGADGGDIGAASGG